jgi:hypothetical protein
MTARKHAFETVIVAVCVLTAAVLRTARAHDAVDGPGGPAFPNDRGPAQIDVSKYPPSIQADYRIFARRCSQCHTLARAINSQYLQLTPEEQQAAKATDPEIITDRKIWRVGDSEWAGVAVKMHAKPGAAIRIHAAELDKVIEFLVFDSKTRKLGARRDAWRAQRQGLLDEFKKTNSQRYQDLFGAGD